MAKCPFIQNFLCSLKRTLKRGGTGSPNSSQADSVRPYHMGHLYSEFLLQDALRGLRGRRDGRVRRRQRRAARLPLARHAPLPPGRRGQLGQRLRRQGQARRLLGRAPLRGLDHGGGKEVPGPSEASI